MTDEQIGQPGATSTEATPEEPGDAGTAGAEPAGDGARIEGAPGPSSDASAPVQHGVGPFSIRETILGGVWLLAFLFSFFSLSTRGFGSVWSSGLLWVLTIAVPTAAVFLIALRRLSPQGIRRVGSLGIDQFASVAFSVSAVLWIQLAWETVSFAIQTGVAIRGWVLWVEVILALAGVILTVVAPYLPVLADDFEYREPAPAHRVARSPRPISPRPDVVVFTPAPARPASAGPAPRPADASPAPADPADETETAVFTAVILADDSDVRVAASSARQEAFWALAPEARTVHDEYGAPLFEVGPSAWALVIEDRGELFVVRHEDGRVGYLHDVTGVTRG